MTEGRMREILSESGALLSGHFVLASGQHSETYLQCARLLMHPALTEEVATAIADRLGDLTVETVCGPAVNGTVLGYELARRLGAKAIYTEDQDGVVMMRRGFTVEPGEKVLIVDDVVAAGGAVRETLEILREQGAEIVGVASLVDRGGGKSLGVPFTTLLEFEPPTWDHDRCPLCERGLGVVKPS